MSWAQTCDQLKKDLFALEHKYQTASLKDCDELKTQSRYCQKENNPASKKTIYQAQLEYNQALAKVNMLEGLIAVSKAVEDSHHALKTIEPAQLSQVNNSINSFLQNFDKAILLNKSMQANDDGEYIWEGYEGDSYQYTYAFIQNRCKSAKFKKFCEELKLKEEQDNFDTAQLYNMFHGFAQADSRLGYQKQMRDENYNKFTNYLKFRSNKNEKPVELEKLRPKNGETSSEVSEIQKVLDLQKSVVAYQNSNDPKEAQKIIKLSNELDEIKMNFNAVELNDTEVQGFITENFEKNLTSISSATGILSGVDNIKNNFTTVKNSLEITMDSKEKTLLKKIDPIKSKLKNKCNMNLQTAEDVGTCLKDICGNSFPSHCTQDGNKDLFSHGLASVIKDYKLLNNTNDLSSANSAMLECLELKTNIKRFECLEENKKKISHLIDSDDLGKAKEKLELAKKTFDFLNKGQNIKKILAEKYITIKTFKNKNCAHKDKQAGFVNSYCDVQLFNLHAKNALELNDGVGKILFEYDKEQYNDFFNNKGKFSEDRKGLTHYDKMIRDCKEDESSSSVCPYFAQQEKNRLEKKRKRERLLRKKQTYLNNNKSYYEEHQYAEEDYIEDEGPSSFAYAMGGLTKGVVQNMPGIFNYLQTKKQHERQTQMWDNSLKYQQYYYGAGANHHTYNLQVNYDDWYANQNTFNPSGSRYFNPGNSLYYPNSSPVSYTMNNGALYLPAK